MTDFTQQPWWPTLTPAMRASLNGMVRAGHPPMQTLSPEQARRAYSLGAQVLEEDMPRDVRRQDRSVTARDGHVLPVRLYTPQPTAGQGSAANAANAANAADGAQVALSPAILYIHGGGFTIGGIGTHDVLCSRLAAGAGATVVSLDYRLAPEHRFPTAVQDAWDALSWLAGHGAHWGLDGRRLAVAGDSAGGTLAAVMALMARDAGLPLQAQCLIYPGTTAHQDSPSHAYFSAGPILSKPLIDWFFAQYIDVADREDWRFAPLLAPDLEGVAPAQLILAECDPLVDEGVAYADHLRMAGVPVELDIYRGVAHEFIKMGRILPEAAAAHTAMAAFLRQRLQ